MCIGFDTYSQGSRTLLLLEYLLVLHFHCLIVLGFTDSVPFLDRVFRIMFMESKTGASAGRFTSPLVRRRPANTMYMSPQTSRKNSGKGFARMKKKSSVPLLPLSPSTSDSENLSFKKIFEDPKNIPINEQV